MKKSNLTHYLHLHFIVFIWGFTAIIGKLISVDAIPLVWYRMLLASLFLGAYFVVKKGSFKLDSISLLKFFLSGAIISLHWITFFKAIKVSNVSIALVMMSTGAFFTSFIEPFFFKRKIKIVEILLGLIAVGGLYIIFNFESEYWLGIIYALISSFLGALFSVLNGLFVRNHSASLISFYQVLFGAICITLFLLIKGSFSPAFFKLHSRDWIFLLILSSVCTAYAFVASVKLMKYLTPYTVVLTINLEPVYAIILALIIFGENEKMNPTFYLGAGIVLFVVFLNGTLKYMKEIIFFVEKIRRLKK